LKGKRSGNWDAVPAAAHGPYWRRTVVRSDGFSTVGIDKVYHWDNLKSDRGGGDNKGSAGWTDERRRVGRRRKEDYFEATATADERHVTAANWYAVLYSKAREQEATDLRHTRGKIRDRVCQQAVPEV